MEKKDRFAVTTYSEGRTGKGQLVEFGCVDGKEDAVKRFLKFNISHLSIPTTRQVSVPHGGYGQYTRYNIVQHDYAGGGFGGNGGYIEVLEIKDPPDSRWGIVINEYNSRRGFVFTEWKTLKHARDAYAENWNSQNTAENLSRLPGFKRRVACGALTPWFYAIGDEQLIGDYAFPEGLQDDPVYRFGRKFVVFDEDGFPEVKTCMGTLFIQQKSIYYPYNEYQSRLVYWDDGSIWDESRERNNPPRPAEEGELWIAEAVKQFRQLLAGNKTEFAVNFTDGNKFVGKLVRSNHRTPCAEGDYYLVVHFKDKKGKHRSKQGWVSDFKPTPEAPDIVKYVTQRFTEKGEDVKRIEIKTSGVKKGGKKWAGVFFHPPK